ncbi:MAG TPA: hypothetical protein VER11_15080, partial [Polyangiaceae bacterium]|nr:hypothetical protein [Polyangiaceae bacterium]
MRLTTALGSISAASGLVCLFSAMSCSQSNTGSTPAGTAGASSVAGAPGQVGTAGASTGASGAPATGGASNPSTAGSSSSVAGAVNGAGGAGGVTSGGGGASGGPSATGGSSGAVGAAGAAACAPPTVSLSGADAVVGGKLIQFNDNGGWCWYQDERVVVDTKANKLVIGSVASGGSRNGYQEAVIYDIAAGTKKLFTLSTGLASNVDDHNAPAFLVRPDGKYFAMWSGHRSDCLSRTSIFDGSAWSAEKKFDWAGSGCPWAGASTNMVTYSNPWYIGTSIYAGVRSVGTDPAILTSTDDGATLSYYGRLMATKQTGYVAGYFKYWGNNTDRIDFVGTEAHPRDKDTSLFHGYIKDGKVYDSMGAVKDDELKDPNSTTSTAVDINTYTPVFKTGSTIGGVKLEHAWNHDIVRYADGTIAILGQARVTGTGSDDPDKRMLYFRFDGTTWKSTYLVKAGTKLYPDEQDYTGLGALVPDDPTTIYISSPYDPTTDKMGSSGKREIWRGTTCDNGTTFKWTPVTANSTKDNIRPVVPRWDASHTALLWMQGTYTSAQ